MAHWEVTDLHSNFLPSDWDSIDGSTCELEEVDRAHTVVHRVVEHRLASADWDAIHPQMMVVVGSMRLLKHWPIAVAKESASTMVELDWMLRVLRCWGTNPWEKDFPNHSGRSWGRLWEMSLVVGHTRVVVGADTSRTERDGLQMGHEQSAVVGVEDSHMLEVVGLLDFHRVGHSNHKPQLHVPHLKEIRSRPSFSWKEILMSTLGA